MGSTLLLPLAFPTSNSSSATQTLNDRASSSSTKVIPGFIFQLAARTLMLGQHDMAQPRNRSAVLPTCMPACLHMVDFPELLLHFCFSYRVNQ